MGRVLIYSFAAATLGGLDSLGGAVVAGIIVGLVQTMARWLRRRHRRPSWRRPWPSWSSSSSWSSNRPACSAPSGSSASDGAHHLRQGTIRRPPATSSAAWLVLGLLSSSSPCSLPGVRSSLDRLPDPARSTRCSAYAVAILGLNLRDRLLRPDLARHSRRSSASAPTPRSSWSPTTTGATSRRCRCPSALCFVVGLLVGLPALRISGLYLAVVTLAVAYVFPTLVLKYESLTGGPNGKKPDASELLPPSWMPFDRRRPLSAEPAVPLLHPARDRAIVCSCSPATSSRAGPGGPSSPSVTTRRAPPSAASTCRSTRR